MRIAIVGSRNITVENIGQYLPDSVCEIVSGGAKGVDACAAEYAVSHKIALKEFLPEYEKYGRAAPVVRNKKIVDYADEAIAFWDGVSKGTLSVIRYCEKIGKKCMVVIMDKNKLSFVKMSKSKTVFV